MFRMLLCSLGVLAFCGGSLLADDVIKGTVKSVDTGKNTITVTVDDKDQTLTLAKDAKVVHLVGKKIKKATLEDVTGGLGAVAVGADVTLTTEKTDDKVSVTQVKVEGLSAKKKKKAT